LIGFKLIYKKSKQGLQRGGIRIIQSNSFDPRPLTYDDYFPYLLNYINQL